MQSLVDKYEQGGWLPIFLLEQLYRSHDRRSLHLRTGRCLYQKESVILISTKLARNAPERIQDSRHLYEEYKTEMGRRAEFLSEIWIHSFGRQRIFEAFHTCDKCHVLLEYIR